MQSILAIGVSSILLLSAVADANTKTETLPVPLNDGHSATASSTLVIAPTPIPPTPNPPDPTCGATATPESGTYDSTKSTIKSDSDGYSTSGRNSAGKTCTWTITCPASKPYMYFDADFYTYSGDTFSIKNTVDNSVVYQHSGYKYSTNTWFFLSSTGTKVGKDSVQVQYYSGGTSPGFTLKYYCREQQCISSTTTLNGNQISSTTLDVYSSSSSTVSPTGQNCLYTLQCPVGSFVGLTDLDFNLNAGTTLEFLNGSYTGSDVNVQTMVSIAPTSSSSKPFRTGYTYSNKEMLFGYANSVKVKYNTGTGSQGYGFQISFMCFTDLCPSALSPSAPTNVSTAQRTQQTWYGKPAFGTLCTHQFSCNQTSDLPIVTYKGPYSSYRGSVATSLNVTYGASGSAEMNIVMSSSSYIRQTFSGPISLTLSPPSSWNDFTSSYTSSSTYEYYRYWAVCQPASAGTCATATRAGTQPMAAFGSTLNYIYGDPDGTSSTYYFKSPSSCSYTVSCPTGTDKMIFTGYQSSSSYGSLGVRASDTSTYTSFYTGSKTVSFVGVTSADITWSATSSYTAYNGFSLSYSCSTLTCSSPNATHNGGTTLSLTETALVSSSKMLIPNTGVTKLFYSDNDGAKTSSRGYSSFPDQFCSYTVACPTGYYIMLNLTGYFTGTSRGNEVFSASSGSTKYEFSYPTAYSYTYAAAPGYSQLTKLQSATIRMSSTYSSSYAYGYQAAVSCTKTKEGSCPWTDELTAFDMTSGSTSRVFNTYITSSSSPRLPSGISCTYTLKCPVGKTLRIDQSYTSSSNSDRPVFKTTSGTTISYTSSSYSYQSLGVSDATMEFTRREWNMSSSYDARGSKLTIDCGSGSTSYTPYTPSPYATPTPPGTSTSTNSSSSSAATCHYTKTNFTLQGGVRNNIELDFTGPLKKTGSESFEWCNFAFSCPSRYKAVALKLTQTGAYTVSGTGSSWSDFTGLFVYVNTSQTSSTTTSVSKTSPLDSVTAPAVVSVAVWAFSSGYKAALAISCVSVPVPSRDKINYISTSSTSSSSSSVSTTSSRYNSFSSYAYSRRAYSTNTKKAFLISCDTNDQTTSYKVAQITQVSGSTGSEGDFLNVTNLDNDQHIIFAGSSVSKTYTSSTSGSAGTWRESSSFYVQWTSDGIYDSSRYGLTIYYRCASSTWTVSGAGSEVANSDSSGSSAAAEEEDVGLIVMIVFGVAIGLFIILGICIAICIFSSRKPAENRNNGRSIVEQMRHEEQEKQRKRDEEAQAQTSMFGGGGTAPLGRASMVATTASPNGGGRRPNPVAAAGMFGRTSTEPVEMQPVAPPPPPDASGWGAPPQQQGGGWGSPSYPAPPPMGGDVMDPWGAPPNKTHDASGGTHLPPPPAYGGGGTPVPGMMMFAGGGAAAGAGGAATMVAPATTSRCAVCFQGKTTHAFLPCGHLEMCGSCAAVRLSKGGQPYCTKCFAQAEGTVEVMVFDTSSHSGACLQCHKSSATFVLTACGHRSLCGSCASHGAGATCPQCQQTSPTTVEVDTGAAGV